MAPIRPVRVLLVVALVPALLSGLVVWFGLLGTVSAPAATAGLGVLLLTLVATALGVLALEGPILRRLQGTAPRPQVPRHTDPPRDASAMARPSRACVPARPQPDPEPLGHHPRGMLPEDPGAVHRRSTPAAVASGSTRVIAGMGHELRTPLTAIAGFADLLAEYRIDDVHREYVENIRHAAHDLLHLVNEMLDYASIESGTLRVTSSEFELYELAGSVVDLLSPGAIDKGLDVFLYIDPEVPTHLHSDPLRLKQVLLNLLGNAIKFTQHGHVALELRCYRDGPDHRLQVEVHDTGPGIAPAQVDHVFHPFSQGQSTGVAGIPGTGLGLAVTREIVTRLGGEVGYHPHGDQGSTFWFTLPCHSREDPPYYAGRSLKGQAALIYDTEPERAEYTCALVEGWGGHATVTDTMPDFMGHLDRTDYRYILYYLSQNEVDTNLQFSMERLSRTAAIKVFMHRGSYSEAPSPISGVLHLSSTLLPNHLLHYLWEAARAADTTSIRPLDPGFAPKGDLSGKSILVADDDPVNRRLLEVYVSRNRGRFIPARDGQEAIDKSRGEVDAVIMDIHMPRVDGIEAMRAMQRHPHPPPVIALTAHGAQDSAAHYRRLGFHSCLGKPVSEQELIETLRRVLATQTPDADPTPSAAEPARQAPRPGDLPSLDLDGAIEIAGGNRDLAHELYNMLLVDLRTKRRQLQALHPDRDREALKALAHKICGGAKFCAVRRVEDCAARLEATLAAQVEADSARGLTDELLGHIDALLAQPNPYLEGARSRTARGDTPS